ncbi:hypothetical protein [Paenibacillus sp. Leaf72]|uniref:hypothetical protein n=1 Tax=Paenibacillus sp. Leaf72 TaxID=1736234 RepID=UPI0012DE879D|nr:hypothetical protein [Paenibacillus sp. Leaf72]
MANEQKITSDDLFKISASLSLIGDGLALLALKKAEEESNNQKAISTAINRLIRKRP